MPMHINESGTTLTPPSVFLLLPEPTIPEEIEFEKLSTLYENIMFHCNERERSGSVVECLTQDPGTAGSSITGVTVLWSLSKTHLS